MLNSPSQNLDSVSLVWGSSISIKKQTTTKTQVTLQCLLSSFYLEMILGWAPGWLSRLRVCLQLRNDPRVPGSRPASGTLLRGESASPSAPHPVLMLSLSQINKLKKK